MGSRYLKFFGGTTEKMQYLPDTPAGIVASREGVLYSMKFDGGGGDVLRTPAGQLTLDINYAPTPAAGAAGLDLFAKYRSGFYGPGMFYVNHPAWFSTNLFAPAWASPKLIEQGWENFGPSTPTFANTAANSYDQPTRSAVWSITTTANAIPSAAGQSVVIPIPPTYTLHLGASGSATGTGAVMVHNDALTVSSLTVLSPTASTRLNATYTGASTSYVRVWLGRTTSATSTLTLTSLMAQLWPTGSSPTLTGSHVAGDGHTGLEFIDDAVPEQYYALGMKALQFRLQEVGAWR